MMSVPPAVAGGLTLYIKAVRKKRRTRIWQIARIKADQSIYILSAQIRLIRLIRV